MQHSKNDKQCIYSAIFDRIASSNIRPKLLKLNDAFFCWLIKIGRKFLNKRPWNHVNIFETCDDAQKAVIFQSELYVLWLEIILTSWMSH